MKILSRNNIQKKKIANNIFNTIGIPTSYAVKLVSDVFSILISNVIIKNHIKIKNFGTFNLKKKTKRIGRNPKNKMKYEIVERNVLIFKAATHLNRKINIDVKK